MGRHTGKLVAGFLGWIFMGLPGALLGLLVGHWFDRGLQHSFSFGSPEKLAEVQREFFNTCFLLLGHVAKADGRVSEQEINHTEAIMRQLGIRGAQRDEAIALFKRGAEQGFDMAPVIAAFNQLCAGHRQVKHALLTFLLGMAAADGHLHPAELELLRRVAGLLGYSAQAFERLVRMVEGPEPLSRLWARGAWQGIDGGVITKPACGCLPGLGRQARLQRPGIEAGLPAADERESPGQADRPGCAGGDDQAGDGAVPRNTGGLRDSQKTSAVRPFCPPPLQHLIFPCIIPL